MCRLEQPRSGRYLALWLRILLRDAAPNLVVLHGILAGAFRTPYQRLGLTGLRARILVGFLVCGCLTLASCRGLRGDSLAFQGLLLRLRVVVCRVTIILRLVCRFLGLVDWDICCPFRLFKTRLRLPHLCLHPRKHTIIVCI